MDQTLICEERKACLFTLSLFIFSVLYAQSLHWEFVSGVIGFHSHEQFCLKSRLLCLKLTWEDMGKAEILGQGVKIILTPWSHNT